MKYLTLILLLLILFSCISIIPMEFVLTGEKYPALGENEEVKVYLSKIPEVKYVEIGIIVLYTNNIEIAKNQARLVGGNALVKLQGVDLKFAIIRLLE